jgi:hypothetical protein
LRTLSLGRDRAVLLPVRFETLSYPLYLDNLMAVLQVLSKDLRPQLIEWTDLPPRLDAMARHSSGSARRFSSIRDSRLRVG